MGLLARCTADVTAAFLDGADLGGVASCRTSSGVAHETAVSKLEP
ncbi:hypothetical protein RQM47_02640 [Rubrivirga sp. S365]|nr:hypothetical protein [Rubrivirga sp. S365]MDT7855534.1 hypothetical protein [Rubrivirga sp. S365]